MSNKYFNEYFIGCIEKLFAMWKNLLRCFIKKKTDLVEMIVSGHITDKINKMRMEDISKKEANQILRSNKILVKPLPDMVIFD